MDGVNFPKALPSQSQATGSVLRERLWRCADADASYWVYALLDFDHPVAVYDSLHSDRLAERGSTVELTQAARPDRPSSSKTWPRLLTLRTPQSHGWLDEELLDLTLGNALARRTSINGAYACGWLVADAAPADMAQCVGRSIFWRDPVSRQQLLPWFEPYRWSLLAGSSMFRHRLKKRLGGVRGWYWVDCAGQLHETVWDTDDVPDEDIYSSVLDSKDWEQQQRVRTARSVLLAATKAGMAPFSGIELAIDEALLTAARLGLTDLEDQLCFSVHYLCAGSSWHRADEARGCIFRAARGETSLADALDALDDESLERIMDPGRTDGLATKGVSR